LREIRGSCQRVSHPTAEEAGAIISSLSRRNHLTFLHAPLVPPRPPPPPPPPPLPRPPLPRPPLPLPFCWSIFLGSKLKNVCTSCQKKWARLCLKRAHLILGTRIEEDAVESREARRGRGGGRDWVGGVPSRKGSLNPCPVRGWQVALPLALWGKCLRNGDRLRLEEEGERGVLDPPSTHAAEG